MAGREGLHPLIACTECGLPELTCADSPPLT
jgi:hypothetical protein